MWTLTFTPDNDKDLVGLAVAVWNAGQADEFLFSGRIDLAQDTAAFIEKAKATQADRASKPTKSAAILAEMVTQLNAEKK